MTQKLRSTELDVRVDKLLGSSDNWRSECSIRLVRGLCELKSSACNQNLHQHLRPGDLLLSNRVQGRLLSTFQIPSLETWG